MASKRGSWVIVAAAFVCLATLGAVTAEPASGLGSIKVVFRSMVDDDGRAPVTQHLAPSKNGRAADAGAGRPVSMLHVFVMTFFMASAAGLGAVPFLFFDKLSRKWAGLSNAIACGVMVAASFDLVHDGEEYGGGLVILGLLLGCLFIKYMQEWLRRYEDVKFEGLVGGNARKALLVVCIMAAHAIGEGAGVGVSYSGQRGWAHGVLVTLAIGFHNIPEGLAVATVMVAKGASVRSAMTWAALCSMPQPVFAVPSFVFVESFRACLPVAMGFAAGSMVWIVFAELLPDALEDVPAGPVASAATLSAVALEALRITLAHLERPNGVLASPVSGDIRAILPAIAAAFASVAFVAVAAAAASTVVRGNSPALLGASVGAQVTLAGFAAVSALQSPRQSAAVTLALAALGAGLTWALWHHQFKALQESLRSVNAALNDALASNLPVSTHDIENGSYPPSHGSWELMSESGRGQQSRDHNEVSAKLRHPSPPQAITFASHSLTIPASRGSQGLPSCSVASIAALLCLLALTGHQVVEGWKAARVAVTAPAAAVTRLMLPMTVAAVAVAVAASGLGPLLVGPGQRRGVVLTALVAAVAPLSLTFSVLRYPTGVHTPDEVPFDPGAWIEKASAMVAGAGLTSAAWALWPHVRTQNAAQGAAGAMGGVLVTAGTAAILGCLCLATPYCAV